ncbi:MAG: hypothetical protein QOG14_1833, partial [Mycobacterium sp.]|nr:hypothetical protein [Mycobacterium sp.]
HIAAVAGEPDRINLACAAILRDDTPDTTRCQTPTAAVLVSSGDVEIAAGPIEARDLKSLCVRAQIGQPIQSTVGIPAHCSFADSVYNRFRRRCACASYPQ